MPLLDKIAIGKRLETCRMKLNLGKTEFAEKAKVDQSQYLKIEKGKLKLSDNIWDKLYATYKLDKAFILLGINIPTSNSLPQLPGPEADLKQLVKVQREFRRAVDELQIRIDLNSDGETDNSFDGNGPNPSGRDNTSKKRRYGKP